MRNKQIDVLKGIGAILVVIGHIVTGTIKNIIYAFHIGIFWKSFIDQNSKKLYLHFAFFAKLKKVIPRYFFIIVINWKKSEN